MSINKNFRRNESSVLLEDDVYVYIHDVLKNCAHLIWLMRRSCTFHCSILDTVGYGFCLVSGNSLRFDGGRAEEGGVDQGAPALPFVNLKFADIGRGHWAWSFKINLSVI